MLVIKFDTTFIPFAFNYMFIEQCNFNIAFFLNKLI